MAYPHKAAAGAVSALRERGVKVVDLSADFRLDRERYEHWYQPHQAPELLDEAVYGLPEAHREQIRAAELVAGPGCNSTAALLALLPLAGRISETAVDIKAGVSGAGREATDETHFVSVVDNVNAYKVEGHRHTAELEQELPGVHFSFVTHLLPIDQGILASCYSIPSGPIDADEARDPVRDRLRRRAVRGGGGRAAAHARRPRHQRGACPGGRRERARAQLLRDRQPLEGRGGTGGPGPQPHARAARDGGTEVSEVTFFRSRWVDAPVHAGEHPDAELPSGFRAAGVAAGIKPEGLDVGVLVSDSPATVSAALFTSNARVGAPVMVTRQADLAALRAVAVNSGCSNVGDGQRGLETAEAMQAAAADKLGLEPAKVGVASTGVIGIELPRAKALSGIVAACDGLGLDAQEFSEAILTSDRGPKRACLQVSLSGGAVRLAAQAKGAGMISPRFATMFCFIQTDAEMAPETLELLTGVCVKRSFDRISVDGQLSTSDTVIAMANGHSGVKVAPESEDELRLGEAFDALLRQLALDIVADGEGARRVGRVVVQGDPEAVEPVARSVANSPLVKAALHGGDPNFGRILQAAGQVWPASAPFIVDLEIEGRQVVSAGEAVIEAADLPALAELVQRDEVEYVITLPGEGGETEVFFSDLSKEYVDYNASYTS